MGKKQQEVIDRIERDLKGEYIITTRKKDNSLGLISNREHYYEPDIILIDKKTKEIVWIIEIETDAVRKSLVGAMFLADYVVMKEVMPKQKKVPILMFISLKPTPPYQKRIDVLNHYLHCLRDRVGIEEYNQSGRRGSFETIIGLLRKPDNYPNQKTTIYQKSN